MPVTSALSVPAIHRPAGDLLAGMSLRAWLAFNPDVAFAAWTGRDRAIVDLIRIPEARRRRGLGSSLYRLWESGLREGMPVELHAIDVTAAAFWSSLGFEVGRDFMMHKTVVRAVMAA